jgi:Fur family transcriptional regulator, ferric uptake regulator
MAKNTEEIRAALRTRGLRATPSRIAVLELLRSEGAPMSHGDAADRLAAQPWDRATIYRNLTDLAGAGLARRTDVGDHVWRFEAVTNDHDSAHPHFVCTECGTVACLPELELAISARAATRSKPPRAVKQRQVEVHVRGLCDACG